jgi:hypothetical protein
LITNASFQDAGSTPGLAAGWTLRSACAREAIAAFAAGGSGESVESFERWSAWTSSLGTAALAPFGPNGTVENFDAWPSALFALELSAGLVANVLSDGFEGGWWHGTPAFRWSDVTQVVGVFAGAASVESFYGWPVGATYLFAFPAGTLTAATFAGGAVEMFTTWTTKNTTLG